MTGGGDKHDLTKTQLLINAQLHLKIIFLVYYAFSLVQSYELCFLDKHDGVGGANMIWLEKKVDNYNLAILHRSYLFSPLIIRLGFEIYNIYIE